MSESFGTMVDNLKQKIVDLDGLRAAVKSAREQDEQVVQCHGCFDIVHPGHIRYLEFARRQGDVLIVTLTGDSDITKGDNRPYIPQELRAENLAALMFVDYVYVTPDPTAATILDQIQPDIYVKGREYENATAPGFLEEKHVVESYGGRIIYSSGEIVFSSTKLIERFAESPDAVSHRLNLLCKRYAITGQSVGSTLDRFRGLNVLVVGDVVIDRYVMCDALGVASESPMLSLVQRDERSYVGGAAIVARHVAALGAHAFLLSAVAADQQSKSVREVLDAEGVESHLIETRPSVVEKTRFIVDDSKVLKVDKADRLPLDSLAERRAALILEQQSKVADAVIFCDFGYGMITGSLLARVLPTLRQNVGTIAADVSGGRGNLLNFRNVDLLCPTEREVRTMLNDFESGLSAVAWSLLERTQARHLFITLEKRGIVVFERRNQDRNSPEWSGRLKSETLPSLADYPLDRLGCGDALLASATCALAADAGVMQTAYLASAAAALEIADMGNNPVEANSLRNWVKTRRELSAQPTPKTPEHSLV